MFKNEALSGDDSSLLIEQNDGALKNGGMTSQSPFEFLQDQDQSEQEIDLS